MPEKLPNSSELISGKFAVQAALEAIGPEKKMKVGESKKEVVAAIEKAMLKAVHGLPEEIAEKTKSVDASILNKRAQEIIEELDGEVDATKRSELQTELIYQYIALISRVQGSGEKAFTPELAREMNEMDCSLSAWSLKEKLMQSGLKDLSFRFGYPTGHAVGIVKLSNGENLYVDAQNGFAVRIDAKQVKDEANTDTAYPIYEITSSKRLSGDIPGEGKQSMTRPNGSDYLPKYLGVREDGVLHTIGNMHMLVNPESPVYDTETAKQFRENLKNDPEQWKKFEEMVDKVAGGKVIEETRFSE